jgi:hypothetical protein
MPGISESVATEVKDQGMHMVRHANSNEAELMIDDKAIVDGCRKD